MVVCYDPKSYLPSSAELPDSDDKPVDNELQNLIPNLLDGVLAILARWGASDDLARTARLFFWR